MTTTDPLYYYAKHENFLLVRAKIRLGQIYVFNQNIISKIVHDFSIVQMARLDCHVNKTIPM